MEIRKVSEITDVIMAEYLKEDYSLLTADEKRMLDTMINVSKIFASNYTGIPQESETEKTIDDYPDFMIVVFVMVQDMWDNGDLYVDKTNLNFTVESILRMHSINLL